MDARLDAMRIVVLAPHFAEYSTRLAAALGARADVLLINERANLRSECEGLDVGGVGLRRAYNGRIAMGGPSPRRFLGRRSIRRTIEAFRPDIIHVQEQGDDFTATLIERLAPLCPIILTVHDPVPHSGNDALVAQRFASGLARLRQTATAYHVHGVYCESALRKRIGTAKPMAATRHGVILVPTAAQKQEPEDRILFFGRMEAYKGLDVLLDAIDRLPQGATRYVLAGRGPELERFRERIAANPSIEVVDRFLPPVDAIREFQRARAVVVPYRDATQSGVISAAFGNGRPIVASRVGGLIDSVADGENGLLVAPGDPAALAAALGRLADPAFSARLAEGAWRAGADAFSWARVAASLDDLYRSLTGLPAH